MSNAVDFEDEIDASNDLFDCEFTSVDAVINQVTVFTGYEERQTENGPRALIAYGEGYCRSAFFTDSKRLKDVVSAPDRQFPFRAVIKVVNYGNMYGFKFFSPKTEITEDDRKNYEYYKRSRNRRGNR